MMSTLAGVQGAQCLGNAPCSSFELLQFCSNGHQWVWLHVLPFWAMQTHAASKQDVCSVSKKIMRIDQHATADGT